MGASHRGLAGRRLERTTAARRGPPMRLAENNGGSMATARCEGFQLIRLAGEPYARGVQHGRALRADVWALWEACERLILNARGPRIGWGIRQALVGAARLMERFVDRELRLELRGVADGSGLAYSRLLLLNC